MKKTLALLLAIIMIAACFAACGGDVDQPATTDQPGGEAPVATEAPVAGGTES